MFVARSDDDSKPRHSGFELAKENGGLCGNGEMSMLSIPPAGEDEGMGGVVTLSHLPGVVAPSAIS